MHGRFACPQAPAPSRPRPGHHAAPAAVSRCPGSRLCFRDSDHQRPSASPFPDRAAFSRLWRLLCKFNCRKYQIVTSALGAAFFCKFYFSEVDCSHRSVSSSFFLNQSFSISRYTFPRSTKSSNPHFSLGGGRGPAAAVDAVLCRRLAGRAGAHRVAGSLALAPEGIPGQP